MATASPSWRWSRGGSDGTGAVCERASAAAPRRLRLSTYAVFRSEGANWSLEMGGYGVFRSEDANWSRHPRPFNGVSPVIKRRGLVGGSARNFSPGRHGYGVTVVRGIPRPFNGVSGRSREPFPRLTVHQPVRAPGAKDASGIRAGRETQN
jgi:hypothetical protein